jgi:putative MATE family efflux protein
MEDSWKSYKGLWALSIPSIIATMLEPISSVVDTALVGKFNTEYLAALAIGATLISSLTWMFNFLVHAPIQGVSDRIGKGRYDEVVSLCKVSLLLALGLGLVLIVVFYPIRHLIYEFMGAKNSLIQYCDEYFVTRLLGQSFILLFTVCLSLLRGFARVKEAMIFIGVSTSINVILSYLSLYHFDFGLRGVAAATVLGNAVGFVLSFVRLISLEQIKEIFWKQKIIRSNIFELGANALNIFGRSAVLTLSFFLCTKIASHIGIIELAAHQIILQIWLFASFFTDGVATTGNIVGARAQIETHREDLLLIFKKLLWMGAKIGLAFSLSLYFLDHLIISRFTDDQRVVEVIGSVWIVVVLSQVPLSIAYVYDGLIFGIGNFSFLRRHMLVAFVLVFMPFAIYAYMTKSLIYIWLALTGIGIYRLASNYYCIKKELQA